MQHVPTYLLTYLLWIDRLRRLTTTAPDIDAEYTTAIPNVRPSVRLFVCKKVVTFPDGAGVAEMPQ